MQKREKIVIVVGPIILVLFYAVMVKIFHHYDPRDWGEAARRTWAMITLFGTGFVSLTMMGILKKKD